MNGPTGDPDPHAMTQPIPVVTVPPPERGVSARPMQRVASDVPPEPAVTPAVAEGVPRYAHRFGSIPTYLAARFAAFVLDIFGVGFVLATFGYHATDLGGFIVAGHDPDGYATLVSLSLGIALAFAFLCESIFGTTIGKLLFALHTRRANGRHAGPMRVFLRYLIRPIDLLIVGPLLALVTPRHQRIGDVVAGTVVSRSRIGPFAIVLGLLAIGGTLYAQTVFGGGLTSAIGVTAETADYGPGLVGRITSLFGVPAMTPLRVGPRTSASDAPGASGATPVPIPSGAVQ
ncbi:MAG: hypothetical protein NVS1B2_13030 [Vulcanimicrobiaceae bacterium]